MSLKAVLSKEGVEALPESDQAHYVENGDVWNLEVTSVNGVELSDNSKLKKALESERKKAKETGAKLKVFGDMDAEAAREALAKVQELADWNPEEKLTEAKKEYEKQIADKYAIEAKKVSEKFVVENKTLTEKNGSLRTQLQDTMVNAAVLKAITDAKGSPELLSPVVQKSIRMIEDETTGIYRTEVIDKDGAVRISTKAGSVDHMTIPELVAEMKDSDVFSRAFDGSGATGSGASGNERIPKGGFTISEVDSLDVSKYRAAKATAEKAGKTLQIATG